MVRMAKRPRYTLRYAAVVLRQLAAIDRKHHSMIRQTLERQLGVEPDVETRNRKPLRRSALMGGDWELRLGPDNRLRAFYEVHHEIREVWVLAIGEKHGSRLCIGGEEVDT